MKVQLISNGTTGAGNGAPSVSTDGVAIRKSAAGNTTIEQGFESDIDTATVLVEGVVTASTVGSIASVKLWGWYEDAVHATNKWFPLGRGADANKGKLNNAVALGETGTDLLRHAERVHGFREASRLYAEYGALSNVTRVDITMISRG